ncbi:MAG: hypothetical protein D8M58_21520 [Calditrichaeota bacterium]|nr:MAG: hypothetical protein DWQ03_00245 [Calditrichota bacterium]MBL1207994.1 hypothetical protein [Calditrichota bacterium]NOG47831.1 hypothetical protein [Calditrichota bacterium]
MKVSTKPSLIPFELSLKFETLEELQAFEMLFHVAAVMEADFIEKHLGSNGISAFLPNSYTEEQLNEVIADVERHYTP